MRRLGLEREMIDPAVYELAIERFRASGIILPTFAQLADPARIPARITARLASVEPDAADPANLFRAHWFNDDARTGIAPLPAHLVLPPELTGVEARIVIALGDRFPMIHSHKVIAAYGCLAPRIVTGQFDPSSQRAIWPSTGNYCRGGVAISRIMGCRGVAVLPEGMSRERFDWLEHWVADPADIIKTPGTESNVKEIYDKCAELDREPDAVIFNQFSEFGNHIAHYAITGRALSTVFGAMQAAEPGLRLRAFVSATGSAGTIGAGDYLKEHHGSLTVAVEAVECPTLLSNGFGEHNIQGIGDKHVPLIHNVMATDIVAAVSDQATDHLFAVFNTPAGHDHLRQRRGVDPAVIAGLRSLGFSSICNIVAAVKTARQQHLGPDDVVMTVATDGAEMYGTELDRIVARDFPGGFDAVEAAGAFGRFMLGATTDSTCSSARGPTATASSTWATSPGWSSRACRSTSSSPAGSPEFWTETRAIVDTWDRLIDEFNARTGALASL